MKDGEVELALPPPVAETERSVSVPNSTAADGPPANANAKPGPPPQVKVIGIFCGICLYFSLIIAPFLGAAANPDRNIARFNILVADLDGGLLGQALTTFYTQSLPVVMPTIAAKLGGTSQALPTFTVTTSSATPSDLQTRVQNNEAWAGKCKKCAGSVHTWTLHSSHRPHPWQPST
jgi:hypothetical protein